MRPDTDPDRSAPATPRPAAPAPAAARPRGNRAVTADAPPRTPTARSRRAARPVVLLLEGGGALGAYIAGVWRVLASRLDAPPVAIAGSSIGALNAALIARHLHEPDRGAAALERFWRDDVATASLPLAAGWAGPRLDGMLTNLLVGNRALHTARPWRWHPASGLLRAQYPLADRDRMAALLDRRIGRVHGHAPWLGVAAVDVVAGRLRLFDSAAGGVGVAELLASSAVPIVYAPVEIDGRLYWDGDMTRDSMLGPVLARLRETGHLAAGTVPRLITVSLRSLQAAERPVSGLELSWRMLELLLHGKLDRDEAHHAGVPDPLVIRRGALPGDALSREFDYTPRRIDELIAQGAREAEAALGAASE